jgi:hypothetical protein
VTGESGYVLERASDIGGAFWTTVANLGPDVTSFTQFDLAEATRYSYRVRALGGIGTSGAPIFAPVRPNDRSHGVVSRSTLGYVNQPVPLAANVERRSWDTEHRGAPVSRSSRSFAVRPQRRRRGKDPRPRPGALDGG